MRPPQLKSWIERMIINGREFKVEEVWMENIQGNTLWVRVDTKYFKLGNGGWNTIYYILLNQLTKYYNTE